MLTGPDRSILDPRRSDRMPSRTWDDTVWLNLEDALPVSVTVEMDDGDTEPTVTVTDWDHAHFRHGQTLGQYDIDASDWARIQRRC